MSSQVAYFSCHIISRKSVNHPIYIHIAPTIRNEYNLYIEYSTDVTYSEIDLLLPVSIRLSKEVDNIQDHISVRSQVPSIDIQLRPSGSDMVYHSAIIRSNLSEDYNTIGVTLADKVNYLQKSLTREATYIVDNSIFYRKNIQLNTPTIPPSRWSDGILFDFNEFTTFISKNEIISWNDTTLIYNVQQNITLDYIDIDYEHVRLYITIPSIYHNNLKYLEIITNLGTIFEYYVNERYTKEIISIILKRDVLEKIEYFLVRINHVSFPNFVLTQDKLVTKDFITTETVLYKPIFIHQYNFINQVPSIPLNTYIADYISFGNIIDPEPVIVQDTSYEYIRIWHNDGFIKQYNDLDYISFGNIIDPEPVIIQDTSYEYIRIWHNNGFTKTYEVWLT